MFTGIIEEIGKVRSIRKQGQTMIIALEAEVVTRDVHLGDSIAVNGVCLTVVAFDAHSVAMDVMPETFRHTNLKELSVSSPVNLERAMAAGGRFGGHFVQGHVDGIGIIRSRTPEENAVVFEIEPERAELLQGIIPKGSITLDGISLTVVDRTISTFRVSIIPHTLQQTILRGKHPGDTLNIECDMIGKYIEQLLKARGILPADGSEDKGLSLGFLAEHGFA